MLSVRGVEVHEDGVALARYLRKIGIKTGVVSASKNCRAVLESAGIQDLFETRVDGEVADLLGLPSKPAPEKFLKAATQLRSIKKVPFFPGAPSPAMKPRPIMRPERLNTTSMRTSYMH